MHLIHDYRLPCTLLCNKGMWIRLQAHVSYKPYKCSTRALKVTLSIHLFFMLFAYNKICKQIYIMHAYMPAIISTMTSLRFRYMHNGNL